MSGLSDFIQVYEGAVPAHLCHRARKLFDDPRVDLIRRDVPDHLAFTEVNLSSEAMRSDEGRLIVPGSDPCDFLQLHSDLNERFANAFQSYYADLGQPAWPENSGVEGIRVKRYGCDYGDSFPMHVDVGDYSSARRYVAAFCYLNTVAAGGETEFFLSDGGNKLVRPVEGTIVVFPPLWMFPHKGNAPVSSDKFIASCYLHYVSADELVELQADGGDDGE